MAVVLASISTAKQNSGVSATFVHAAAPAGLQVGDLLVYILGETLTPGGSTISGPGTWTKQDQSNPTTINFPKAAFWTKIADAGDLTGNYTFTNSVSSFSSRVGAALRITGHDPVNFLDGFAVAFVENIVSANMATPSLLTVADNVLVIRCPFNNTAGSPATNVVPPSGVSEVGEEITTGLFGSWNTEDVLQTPPGATGIETFTHDGTSSSRVVMYTIGIAPAAVPPGGGPAGGPRSPFRILAKRWRVLGTGA